MEQITPQYKRGKYINRRNRGKRIAVICLCVAVVLAAAAVLLYVFRDRIFPKGDVLLSVFRDWSVPKSDTATVPTDESGLPVSTADPPSEGSTEATEAPALGREVPLADGKLLLTYDSDVLSLVKDTNLTTLLEKSSDAEIPRMDIQQLPSKLGMLRDSELERISIGLMQAYYYRPQHTEDVAITVTQNDKREFAATMDIPAIGDAPAAVCSVRLLAAGDELWAAVLLQPEGMENEALTNAFQWLTPIEENGN